MMVSKAECHKRNAELLAMIAGKCFDCAAAERLLEEIPDINRPIRGLIKRYTTCLMEAQVHNNLEAVRFLLEHGADPNTFVYLDDHYYECPLNDLQGTWQLEGEPGEPKDPDEISKRLEIAKLFFEFGGDPNIMVDGETLYDQIIFDVFYEDIRPNDREYLLSFFKLLLAYGGGGGASRSPKPRFTEPIDRSRIDEYTLKFTPRAYGETDGHLINPDGIDIGIF